MGQGAEVLSTEPGRFAYMDSGRPSGVIFELIRRLSQVLTPQSHHLAVFRVLRPLKYIQESLTIGKSLVEDITGKLVTVLKAITHLVTEGTLEHRASEPHVFPLGI